MPGVIKIELGLQCCQLRALIAEYRQGFAQLVRLGYILGVKNHHIVTARKLQPVIQRLGFGQRLAIRHDQQFITAGQIQISRRGNGFRVSFFKQQFYIKLGARVIKRVERAG